MHEAPRDPSRSSPLQSKTTITATTRALRENLQTRLKRLTPHENIYNFPNFLTVSRLIAAPVVGYLVLHEQHAWAFGLFVYAGVTDLVDGWLARRWKLQTVAGSVIDPMADKSLMIILVGCLAAKGLIPLWVMTLILGRDITLAIAAIYYRYASLPTPKTFKRYWDFSIPSAEVHPTTVSKYNTFLQLVLIGLTLMTPFLTHTASLDSNAAPVSAGLADRVVASLGGEERMWQGLVGLQWLVAATTAWSGFSYSWNKEAVTILGDNKELIKKQGARGRNIIGFTFLFFTALAFFFLGRDMGGADAKRPLAEGKPVTKGGDIVK